jgi:dipeptidyl aminopeptidase/acylaminoacyl peptidase
VLVSNQAFSQAKPLTTINAHQKDFYWGKTELVHFKNKAGKDLQGVLMYPAGYEEGKSYPMITYIYEKLSQGVYQYKMPNDASTYNPQLFVQSGYFIFMPDIVYRERNPGLSALDCVTSGVNAVLKKNVGVDPKKLGLMGHSWGGYQTAFIVTQTNMFAAANAGAPLTELRSMYNSFYWNAGITDQVIFESSQGRMAVPWWEDPKSYADNNPLDHAHKIQTPILMEQGDQDGAVDFHQGQQLYNTLRRMGKPIVFLVYNGENHNNARRPNQVDYANRQRHFFDVYLKGVKPEKWLSDGIPFLKKGER